MRLAVLFYRAQCTPSDAVPQTDRELGVGGFKQERCGLRDHHGSLVISLWETVAAGVPLSLRAIPFTDAVNECQKR